MLSVKHLIDTTSLTADDITQILDTARSFSEVNRRAIKKVPALRGRTIVNLFLEPSTRTKSSFEPAEKRLSADSLSMGGATSSVVKGESLADTSETIDAMNVDMFICRAKLAGTPQKITEHTDAIVINAGDGKHQHPTQAMLDLYTIRENFGHLDGLKVADLRPRRRHPGDGRGLHAPRPARAHGGRSDPVAPRVQPPLGPRHEPRRQDEARGHHLPPRAHEPRHGDQRRRGGLRALAHP